MSASGTRADATELLQVDRQQRQLLAEVIVQLARDAATLVVLRDHQPVGQVAQRPLRGLALGDVEAAADVAVERPSCP